MQGLLQWIWVYKSYFNSSNTCTISHFVQTSLVKSEAVEFLIHCRPLFPLINSWAQNLLQSDLPLGPNWTNQDVDSNKQLLWASLWNIVIGFSIQDFQTLSQRWRWSMSPMFLWIFMHLLKSCSLISLSTKRCKQHLQWSVINLSCDSYLKGDAMNLTVMFEVLGRLRLSFWILHIKYAKK